jgi:hypothetical protein
MDRYKHARIDELMNQLEAAYHIKALVLYTNHTYDDKTAEKVLEVAYKMHDEAFEAMVYDAPLDALEMLMDMTDDESHKCGLNRVKSLVGCVNHYMYDTSRLVNSSPLRVVVGLLREIGFHTKFESRDITESSLRQYLAEAHHANHLRKQIAKLRESNENIIKTHNEQQGRIVSYTAEMQKLEECPKCGESYRDCRCFENHRIGG